MSMTESVTGPRHYFGRRSLFASICIVSADKCMYLNADTSVFVNILFG